MKSCPTCNRTFEDTFTFCLADGSLLDAPVDPHATLIIPKTRQTEPPPTELVKREETKQEIPPTIASPIPRLSRQETESLTPSRGGVAASHRKKFKLIYVVIPAVIITSVLTFLYLNRPLGQCPNITVKCYPSQDYAACYVYVDETKPTPKQAKYFRQFTRQAESLIAYIAFFQPPALPATVTDVKWTSSVGRILQQGKSAIRIDTTGLSGQKITVTATVSGIGATCVSTESFIVVSPASK